MTSQNLKLPYLLVFLFNSAQILPRVAYLYKESENAKKIGNFDDVSTF